MDINKLKQQLANVTKPLTTQSNTFNSLTGRHQKLYLLRNLRIRMRKIRMLYPIILAHDLCKVQPMSGPASLFYTTKPTHMKSS